MVGETCESLIINSMKLWQIEIKLQSNRFSRAIVAFSMSAAHARALLCTYACMSYTRINIRVISRSSYRNEIVNEDGLANSDFTLQWIDNETIEHLPIEAYVQFRPWPVQYPKFFKNLNWSVSTLITTSKNAIKFHNAIFFSNDCYLD